MARGRRIRRPPGSQARSRTCGAPILLPILFVFGIPLFVVFVVPYMVFHHVMAYWRKPVALIDSDTVRGHDAWNEDPRDWADAVEATWEKAPWESPQEDYRINLPKDILFHSFLNVLEETYGIRHASDDGGVRWWHQPVILYVNLTQALSFLLLSKPKNVKEPPVTSKEGKVERARQQLEESDYEDHEEGASGRRLLCPFKLLRDSHYNLHSGFLSQIKFGLDYGGHGPSLVILLRLRARLSMSYVVTSWRSLSRNG